MRSAAGATARRALHRGPAGGGELSRKYAAIGTIRSAVRAYNGSGHRAEQYAIDVMRLLPYCEHAARAGTRTALEAAAGDAADDVFALDPDTDPGYEPPAPDASADFETARTLANLGAAGSTDDAEGAEVAGAAASVVGFDINAAKAFL
jgi:hypothetical protein